VRKGVRFVYDVSGQLEMPRVTLPDGRVDSETGRVGGKQGRASDADLAVWFEVEFGYPLPEFMGGGSQ